jgi:hypothetical protein
VASASMKKKGSASSKKAIYGGMSASKVKKKVCKIPPHSHSLHEIKSSTFSRVTVGGVDFDVVGRVHCLGLELGLGGIITAQSRNVLKICF